MIRRYMQVEDEIVEKLDYFYDLVMDSPVNITAIKDKDEFTTKHLLDSIYFFTKRPLAVKSIMDLGSGGGFPGLVIAIFYPNCEVTLVDSIGKKCRFLENSASALNLKNVTVINARAEDIKGKRYDLITARGVSSVKNILKFSSHLVNDKGGWLMYKGERLEAELQEAESDIAKRRLKSEQLRVEEPFTRSYLHLYY